MLKSIESSMFASNKEKTSGEFDLSKDSQPIKPERRPWILVKLSLEGCVI